tara:strand:- start:6079 stop:6729 length:651 start_codon:yes stop_codon:yes gene_type:complete
MLTFTFGKYKNQSVSEVFQKDRQYIKWLCSQLWFQQNHSKLYEESINSLNEYIPKINKDKFIVYTDGACPNNGNSRAKSSIGIHFSEKNSIKIKDVSQPLHMDHHSNNYAEMRAIYECLNLIKKNEIDIPIEIYTDSKYCLSILLEWYEKWLRNNLLKNKKNLSIIEKTYHLYKTFSNINIIHVPSHSGTNDEHSYGNDIADKLARGALKKNIIIL